MSLRGPLFAGLPTPVEMAQKLQLAEILDVLNPDCSDFDDDDISFYDPKTFPRSSGCNGGIIFLILGGNNTGRPPHEGVIL